MEPITNLLANKRLLFVSLFFVKLWYFLWLIFALLSYVFIFYFGYTNEEFKVGRIFIINSVLLIKSIVYFKTAKVLLQLFFQDTQKNGAHIAHLSMSFFILFCFDVSALLIGTTKQDGIERMSQLLLDAIGDDSVFYPFYSKIYLYIPAVFDFIKPDLEGSSLLVLSIVLAGIYRKKNENL